MGGGSEDRVVTTSAPKPLGAAEIADGAISQESERGDKDRENGGSFWESSQPGFTREGTDTGQTSKTREASREEEGKEGEEEKEEEAGGSLEVPEQDYSNLPDLHGAPRAGDTIAFKVGEAAVCGIVKGGGCCSLAVSVSSDVGDIHQLHTRVVQIQGKADSHAVTFCGTGSSCLLSPPFSPSISPSHTSLHLVLIPRRLGCWSTMPPRLL